MTELIKVSEFMESSIQHVNKLMKQPSYENWLESVNPLYAKLKRKTAIGFDKSIQEKLAQAKAQVEKEINNITA